MAYNGLALSRQHIKKYKSIWSVILGTGRASNVIPDSAEGSYSLGGKKFESIGNVEGNNDSYI
jgi:hypothetical protein